MIAEIFENTPRNWRGIGPIPGSGLAIRSQYETHDAEKRFSFSQPPAEESSECMAGKVLQGQIKPNECSAFGGKWYA